MAEKPIVLSQEQRKRDRRAADVALRDAAMEPYRMALMESSAVAETPAAAGEFGGRTAAERSQASLDGAPRLVFDLPMLCHKDGCGTLLRALEYRLFVDHRTERFMLWIEGVCPKCLERRKTAFDPAFGTAAVGRRSDEREALTQMVSELMCDGDAAVEVGDAVAEVA